MCGQRETDTHHKINNKLLSCTIVEHVSLVTNWQWFEEQKSYQMSMKEKAHVTIYCTGILALQNIIYFPIHFNAFVVFNDTTCYVIDQTILYYTTSWTHITQEPLQELHQGL